MSLRANKVHKLHFADVQHLTADALSEMLSEGSVEIIVEAKDGSKWGETLGHFFDKLEHNVDGWRDRLRNKAVIVNFVDRRQED